MIQAQKPWRYAAVRKAAINEGLSVDQPKLHSSRAYLPFARTVIGDAASIHTCRKCFMALQLLSRNPLLTPVSWMGHPNQVFALCKSKHCSPYKGLNRYATKQRVLSGAQQLAFKKTVKWIALNKTDRVQSFRCLKPTQKQIAFWDQIPA